MRIDLITLFPEMCERVYMESITGRAIKAGKLEVFAHNFRDFSDNKHRTVDDTPYGGGGGMLLRAQPIYDCHKHICDEIGKKPHTIYMSPQGKTLTQDRIKGLAEHENLIIICGHYEGVDERLIEEIVDEEISIGDFVLTGGELPALVLFDAVARLLPGVLASEDAFTDESHFSGLLEHPQYTKPAVWQGREVPEILLSGHHAKIEQWRYEQAVKRTKEKRPDLIQEEKKL